MSNLRERAETIVEQWSVPELVEEELAARHVSLVAFLEVTGIKRDRWTELRTGEKRMLLSEIQKVAGALNVSNEFIVNLNLSYRQWKEAQP